MAVNTQFLKVEILAPNDVLDLLKNAGNAMKRKIRENGDLRILRIIGKRVSKPGCDN